MKLISNAKYGEPLETGTIFTADIRGAKITIHRFTTGLTIWYSMKVFAMISANSLSIPCLIKSSLYAFFAFFLCYCHFLFPPFLNF